MPNINYNEKENYFLIYDHEDNKLTGILYTKYNDQCNNGYNDNSGGGDDMEKRIQNIENDIKVIKKDLNENTNKLEKISTKLDNLKENCISYKELLAMLAGFTAIIGFFIRYIH